MYNNSLVTVSGYLYLNRRLYKSVFITFLLIFTTVITLQRYNMEKRLSRTFFFNFIYNSLIYN